MTAIPPLRLSALICTFALAAISVSTTATAGKEPAETGAAAWIWSGATPDPSNFAEAGNVYFRRVFEIPEDAKIAAAVLDFGADNSAEVFLNGKSAGKLHGWNPLHRTSVAELLRPGKNLLAVRGGNDSPGAAGLLLEMKITLEGREPRLRIASNGSWDAATREIPEWQTKMEPLEGFEPVKVVAANGESPWGLVLPPMEDTQIFPRFSAEGADLGGLNDMLRRFHPACNMDIAGTFALAWLPSAMLWVADSPQVSDSRTRARIANRIGRMRLSDEGYVSCHQHEGLAHSEGWPFPMPSQSQGHGFYFTLAGVPYGPEFGLSQITSVDDWKLAGVGKNALDPGKGWQLELTAPDASVTSPAFDLDAFVSPFIRVKWDATGLPEGCKPYLEWTTAEEPEFAPSRKMAFPKPSSSSKEPIQEFDIPVHEISGAKGRITGLRVGFGNPAAGQVTILRIFSAVDSRHTVNNANYLIAAADFFEWTGDKAWLSGNLAKMRRAADYMISEFKVRDASLLRTPWIGHNGRSGLEITPDGRKLIHNGVGIGGNYWDLIPFGGDDAYGTIYLYSGLRRMARIEEFAAGDTALPKPEAGLDAASLNALADAVRAKFQQTFWNPETKRFAPKDDQGRFRDYGFTFLNNEAIFYGLASDTQAGGILSWLDGGRVVEGDTSQGADIYRWRFAPRSSTKRNIEYYAYVWSRPEDLNYGDQVQDGGAVLGFSYHDLMARIRHLGPDNAWKRLGEILAWYDEVAKAGGARAYYSVAGRGTMQGGGTAGGLGIDEEFYESVLAPAIILDGFTGFAVRPDGFDLAPRLPSAVKTLGVSNVAYRNLRWDIDLSRDAIAFHVISGSVDAPLRVRLPEGAWTATFRATADAEPRTVEIPSGPQGFELPAGPLHQLQIVRKNSPKSEP